MMIKLKAIALFLVIGLLASGSVTWASAEVVDSTTLATVSESLKPETANSTQDNTTSAITASTVNSESSIEIKADTPENEIPLRMTASEKAISEEGTGQKAILTIGVLLALVGVGYYLFKRQVYANRSNNAQQMQIKVLTQHFLGPKKSLAIIRVAGETMVIGVTEQNISMIKTLSLLDDELPTATPEDFQQVMQSGFESGESKAVSSGRTASAYQKSTSVGNINSNQTNMREVSLGSKSEAQENAEDEFAFAGIKTTVFQKIKSMRNIQ